jgi:hypothetical protein
MEAVHSFETSVKLYTERFKFVALCNESIFAKLILQQRCVCLCAQQKVCKNRLKIGSKISFVKKCNNWNDYNIQISFSK